MNRKASRQGKRGDTDGSLTWTSNRLLTEGQSCQYLEKIWRDRRYQERSHGIPSRISTSGLKPLCRTDRPGPLHLLRLCIRHMRRNRTTCHYHRDGHLHILPAAPSHQTPIIRRPSNDLKSKSIDIKRMVTATNRVAINRMAEPAAGRS